MRTLQKSIGVAMLLLALFKPCAADTRGTRQPEWVGSLTSFVMQVFDEGVPYGEAHEFGPEALPYLEEWLNDPGQKPNWSNIAVTIGYIGDPKGFEVLRSFVQDRFRGEVDGETFRALRCAQGVLGAIASRSPAALAYLERCTNPESWSSVNWAYHRLDDESLRLLFTKLTITALSMVGTQEAGRFLEHLREKPYDGRQLPNITEGLRRHREIARRGLDGYFNARKRGEINF